MKKITEVDICAHIFTGLMPVYGDAYVMIDFVLENSVDPDEMSRSVALFGSSLFAKVPDFQSGTGLNMC